MAASQTRRFRNPVLGLTAIALVPTIALVSIMAGLVISAGCSATSKLSTLFAEASAAPPAASELLGWTTSHQTGAMESNSTGKTMMLWFTGSDWCRYCTMLENEVFHTATFQDWSAQKIVPVMLDFPKRTKLSPELAEQNDELAERYESFVKGYPTALFVDQQGNVIGKLGYESGGPEHWIKKAEAILANGGEPVVR